MKKALICFMNRPTVTTEASFSDAVNQNKTLLLLYFYRLFVNFVKTSPGTMSFDYNAIKFI